jgi:hypothetical protein
MKKIFLFVVALVGIISCSKSSDDKGNNGTENIDTQETTTYSPPDWIIGTWEAPYLSYIFEKDRFCIKPKSALKNSCSTDKDYAKGVVQKRISADTYYIRMQLVENTTTVIGGTFKKLSATQIGWLNPNGEVEETYTKK